MAPVANEPGANTIPLYIVRRGKAASSSGCESHPANWIVPAGSYRSGGEATKPPEPSRQMHRKGCSESTGRNASECRAGLERVNVGADPPVYWGRPPSLGKGETGGIGRPMSDQTQRSHRGIGSGMSTIGRRQQHGKPCSAEECVLQPDSREGQAGPIRVADRLEVPLKPGNSGGGKGPEFKSSVTKSTRAGRLA